ncbi:MAG: carotenoid biosynthesis protein [Solirubrobacterales bacterium]|nr:carotenoid biosynthesis protein [Solirubrobacterales bacterium]
MRAARALLGALVGAQLVYPRVPAARQPAATRGIVGLMLAASVADLVARRGGRRAAALAGSAAGIGFASELCGVATGRPFGPYDYSGKLGPKVAGVPVLAAAAWTMMAFPSWSIAGLLTRRRAARAALAAGALTAWDLCLDPRMVREGYWTWPGGGRYEDVPASNFLGWFAVGGTIFAVWAVVDGDGAPSDEAVALYAWTWIGEVVANLAFWGRPKVALVGGAAMGAFAAPALSRRLRPVRPQKHGIVPRKCGLGA